MMKRTFLSVPIMSTANSDIENREKTLRELKRCNADRVFISCGSLYSNIDRMEACLINTEETVRFFKQHGFEVGIWILSSCTVDQNDISLQIGDTGQVRTGWRCHADEKLLDLQAYYAKRFAQMEIDLLMYDDDLHFGYGATDRVPGCFCEHHRKAFLAMYGDKLDFDRIKIEFCKEQPNEYRDAWLSLTGATLENFAKRMRQAVDAVDPNIRIGFCANLPNYWKNGISVEALCKAFAGKTKPFVRLIGAPYHDFFVDYPNRLASVVECERVQTELLKDSGIEVMTEGDSYPRPRMATSASHLECFDMIMRADGKANGILKYMLDYHAPADYETGYVDRHVENMDLYRLIETHFAFKKAAGVRIYHFPQKFSSAQYKYCDNGVTLSLFPKIACMLSQLSIPTTYEGRGIAGAAFGENTGFLDDEALQRGIITDVLGARVLKERGIDVGLKAVDGTLAVIGEDFGNGVTHRIFPEDKGHYAIRVDNRAEVLSYYIATDGSEGFDYNKKATRDYPAAYLYENANGQRFCVMAFDVNVSMRAVKYLKEGFRSYAKAKQIAEACEWVGKRKLPVKAYHYPDLYLMCKEDETGTAIGIWNLSKDRITNLDLELDKNASDIQYIGCNGTMKGSEITLDKLYPYEFCGILLKP